MDRSVLHHISIYCLTSQLGLPFLIHWRLNAVGFYRMLKYSKSKIGTQNHATYCESIPCLDALLQHTLSWHIVEIYPIFIHWESLKYPQSLLKITVPSCMRYIQSWYITNVYPILKRYRWNLHFSEFHRLLYLTTKLRYNQSYYVVDIYFSLKRCWGLPFLET